MAVPFVAIFDRSTIIFLMAVMETLAATDRRR